MPFFLVAGMFGNVLNLRHLAHLIGTDRPFFGLQARGLYGDQPPHTLWSRRRPTILSKCGLCIGGPGLWAGFGRRHHRL